MIYTVVSSYTEYNDANIDHQTANLKETPVSESTGALAQCQGPPADRCGVTHWSSQIFRHSAATK